MRVVWPALIVFALTYIVISGQRIPGLRLDRPSAALCGAVMMVLTGTLSEYSQRVMSIRTAHGTFAIILARTTVALPRCGHEPTLQPGERLVVRVPGRGDGTLLARTVQDAGPCPR